MRVQSLAWALIISNGVERSVNITGDHTFIVFRRFSIRPYIEISSTILILYYAMYK